MLVSLAEGENLTSDITRMDEENHLGCDETVYKAEPAAVVRLGDTAPRKEAITRRSEPGGMAPQSDDLETVVLRLFQDRLMPQLAALVQGGTNSTLRGGAGGVFLCFRWANWRKFGDDDKDVVTLGSGR